jgi:hypothetical protein
MTAGLVFENHDAWWPEIEILAMLKVHLTSARSRRSFPERLEANTVQNSNCERPKQVLEEVQVMPMPTTSWNATHRPLPTANIQTWEC